MLTILLLCGAAVIGFVTLRYFQRGPYLAAGRFNAPAPVRAAAKRLEYSAQPNVHAINCINSAELCVTAMAVAFAQMDDNTPMSEATLIASTQRHLQLSPEQASDMTTLGFWLVEQGQGPTPAFQRLTKRLKQLDHGPYFGKMMNVIGDVKATGTKGMASPRQADAMGALARIFRTA
ncbi:hypothetical protein GGR95_001304 [Sulfitobacter undariae]|uniref:Uncharacterized protein n=1 Tax=Sulfitobacter undariae TaxID=1563671 RepID=A0A7W6E8E7_9RHOB|nr:hypothetical protein [Sulfitobacter undariae]MBB3993673.1 hypothetical protein [Sulfitobacter undariae]